MTLDIMYDVGYDARCWIRCMTLDMMYDVGYDARCWIRCMTWV